MRRVQGKRRVGRVARKVMMVGVRALVLGAVGLATLGVVGCSGNPATSINKSAPQGSGMMLRTATINGKEVKYSVFVPYTYKPENKYPTIVFCQGLMEGGSDGVKPTTVGIGPRIAQDPANWPFITIFPQSGGDWDESDAAKAVAVLDDAAKHYNVDQDRVIATGISNGGHGTWLLGALYPNRFAGIVPVAGHKAYDYVPKLTKMPVWAFHNSGDPFVMSGGAKEMVKRINDAGGSAKYTQYSALGHDAWTRAYADPELMKWMLSQRRQ
jgi:predicted peptidase